MDETLPVNIHGIVTAYKGDGRKLGYPTANIAATTTLSDGVYFGHADLAQYKHHPALIFVGVPTTMGEDTRRVEAHLLDITDQDYYSQTLTLSVEYFWRQNHTFTSVEDLLVIMKHDEAAGRTWFAGKL